MESHSEYADRLGLNPLLYRVLNWPSFADFPKMRDWFYIERLDGKPLPATISSTAFSNYNITLRLESVENNVGRYHITLDIPSSPDFIDKYDPGLPESEAKNLIEIRPLASRFRDIFLCQLKELLDEMTFDDYCQLSKSDLRLIFIIINRFRDIQLDVIIPLIEQ